MPQTTGFWNKRICCKRGFLPKRRSSTRMLKSYWNQNNLIGRWFHRESHQLKRSFQFFDWTKKPSNVVLKISYTKAQVVSPAIAPTTIQTRTVMVFVHSLISYLLLTTIVGLVSMKRELKSCMYGLSHQETKHLRKNTYKKSPINVRCLRLSS